MSSDHHSDAGASPARSIPNSSAKPPRSTGAISSASSRRASCCPWHATSISSASRKPLPTTMPSRSRAGCRRASSYACRPKPLPITRRATRSCGRSSSRLGSACRNAPDASAMSEAALPHGAGTAAVTHRRVLALAFPIVLANLTQPILGAVDTAVAGHLDGTQYWAASRSAGCSSISCSGASVSCGWGRRASSRRRMARATPPGSA